MVLIRSGVLLPRMTQDHTGSNLIAFDANGQFVYGLNNETTEFGLRRIEVLADGLAEQAVVNTAGSFGVRALDYSASGLVLDRAIYRAPDLALLGRVAAPSFGCRAPAVPNRLVCMKDPFPSNGEGRLVVVDATSFVIQATPAYAVSGLISLPTQLVAGPAGQVAPRAGSLRVPDEPAAKKLDRVRELLVETLRLDAPIFGVRMLIRLRAAVSANDLIELVWDIERHLISARHSREEMLNLHRARELLGLAKTVVAVDDGEAE